MQKEFEGKVALVTGGSRGIGRAAVVRLAAGGCKVAIGYAGNDAAAAEALAAAQAAGAPGVQLLKFDVGDAAACQRAIDDTVEKLGGLNVLVNNAGISIDGLILRYKAEDLHKVLRVDLESAFHLCKGAAKVMLRKGGSIVNLTSVVGESGNAGQTAYSMAKAGLIGLTKSLARELGSRNVRVNAVRARCCGSTAACICSGPAAGKAPHRKILFGELQAGGRQVAAQHLAQHRSPGLKPGARTACKSLLRRLLGLLASAGLLFI